jgi:hypothetical protein
MKTKFTILTLLLLALGTRLSPALAQESTAFTYQGQLHDGSTNANGAYTMIFALYSAPTGGNQIGGSSTNQLTLVNGLFTVNLDFGNAFDGHARWLDITVTNGGMTQTLTPRVQLLPAPYAQFANAAGSAANIANGSWSATVGNFQSYSNIFSIAANNSYVLALSTNGVIVNGGLQADQLGIGNDYNIEVDYNGGFALNTGNSNADLTINNLTLNGDTIHFPAQQGANISVGTNGDFTFDGNVKITSLGNITLPVLGGSVAISANNQGINVNGISLSTNGIILPGPDRVRSITTTTSGIVLDGVTVSQNTGIVLPNNSGNRTLSAESQGFYMDNNVRVGGYVNATAFNTGSDRNLKEQFQPVNTADVLDRVASLPITSWNFKQDATTRHIGPMAQDFYSAFNVGTDERHIATVDEDGVALAAIQGLNEKLKAEAAEKDAQIKALEKRLSDLETLVKTAGENK